MRLCQSALIADRRLASAMAASARAKSFSVSGSMPVKLTQPNTVPVPGDSRFAASGPILQWCGLGVLLMRQSSSIIPSDRLDRTIYIVLEDFSSGAAWRETDEERTDYRTMLNDLLTGQ